MKKRKVLITGGAGFLGVHLARKLLKDGYQVTLFDVAQLDAKDLLGKAISIVGDVRNARDVQQAIKNQNYVVHAAAALPIQQSKKIIFSINVEGTKNVLQTCLKNKVKRIVFISTTAVYGVPKSLPETEGSPLDPIGDYGKSKIAAENLCKSYMKKGLSINIIRPKTFLGPERLGVFELWFEAIYTGKRVFILGDGNNRYQLLAVSDVVGAIEKALQSRVSGEIFNIGAGEFGSWRTDLGAIITYAKSRQRPASQRGERGSPQAAKSKITGLPVLPSQILLSFLERLHLSPIAEWHYRTLPVDSYVAIEKAEKLLNWHPKKSNEQLLLESYKWYEEHRNEVLRKVGIGHRVGWDFKALNLIKRFF